jgi:O-antigen/teichoic acid export membrane protein
MHVQSTLTRGFQRYRASQLLRSGTWYLLGNLLTKGISFTSLIIYTRLLSPEQYGAVSVSLTWAALLGIFLTLNLSTAVFQAKFEFSENDYATYVSTTIIAGIGIALIGCLVIFLLPADWVQKIFDLDKSYLLLAALLTPFVFTVQTILSRLHAEQNYKTNVIATLALEFAIFVCSIAFILALSDAPIIGRLLGVLLINGVLGVYWAFKTVAVQPRFEIKFLRHALIFAIPLAPHMLSAMVLSQFDRVLINRYGSEFDAGIYSFAYQIGWIAVMIWAAVNTAWSPWLFERLKQEKYDIIRRASNRYVIGFTSFSVLSIFCSPFIVRLIVSEQYWAAIRIIPILLAAAHLYFTYSFFVNIEYYERKTSYISAATIAAALLNIALNLILLPIYGYQIAAWTTLASYFALCVVHFGVVRFVLHKDSHVDLRLLVICGIVPIVLATLLFTAL